MALDDPVSRQAGYRGHSHLTNALALVQARNYQAAWPEFEQAAGWYGIAISQLQGASPAHWFYDYGQTCHYRAFIAQFFNQPWLPLAEEAEAAFREALQRDPGNPLYCSTAETYIVARVLAMNPPRQTDLNLRAGADPSPTAASQARAPSQRGGSLVLDLFGAAVKALSAVGEKGPP